MGMFMSRLSAYSSVVMMDTDAHIHFQQELIDQWETARATGAMQTIAQYQATGAGGSGAVGLGGGYQTWVRVGGIIRRFAPTMVPIGAIMAGLAYAFKWSQGFMMVAIFLSVFFLVYLLSYLTIQRINISDGTTFFVSLFSAFAVSFAVAFFVYDPHESAEPAKVVAAPAQPQPQDSFLTA